MNSEDRAAIEQLKHRYFRLLDLKRFEELGTLLLEEATASYGEVAPDLQGRAAILEFLDNSLSTRDIVSVHHGHHPEIEETGPDTAEGVWYLYDRVIIPRADLELGGTAIYHDRYARREGAWLIAHTGYERIFEEQRRHGTGELLSFSSRFDA